MWTRLGVCAGCTVHKSTELLGASDFASINMFLVGAYFDNLIALSNIYTFNKYKNKLGARDILHKVPQTIATDPHLTLQAT